MHAPPSSGPTTTPARPPKETFAINHKKLLVPIGAAIGALSANISYADKLPAQAPHNSSEQGEGTKTLTTSIDPVLQRLMYQIGQNTHTLTLHKSSSGTLYAQHGSHSSHGSHVSHGSHRSGY